MEDREKNSPDKHSLIERLTLAKEVGKVLPEVIIQEGFLAVAVGGLYTTIGAGLSSWGFFLTGHQEATKISAIVEAIGLGTCVVGAVGSVSLAILYTACACSMGDTTTTLPIDRLRFCIDDYKQRKYR